MVKKKKATFSLRRGKDAAGMGGWDLRLRVLGYQEGEPGSLPPSTEMSTPSPGQGEPNVPPACARSGTST